MAKTYACGTYNKVVRLDDHDAAGLGWIEIPATGDNDTQWNDIMSDPLDETKVVVVGANTTDNGATKRGIQVSTDSGANWTIPGGTWSTNETVWYELWWVDSTTIWVVGSEGRVAISVDGGVTFDLVATQIAAGAYWNTAAIFAIDGNTAVVLGNDWPGLTTTELFVWKTTDAGATWNLLNGGVTLPPPPGANVGTANAIWMSPDETKIIAASSYNQYVSTNSGASFTDILSPITRSGYHMTWYPAYDALPAYFHHVGGMEIQVVSSDDPFVTWNETRSTALGDAPVIIKGAHFYGPADGYYTIEHQIFATADSAQSGVLSYTETLVGSPSPVTFNAVWTSETITASPCYELEDCEGVRPSIFTTTDLSAYVGTIITIKDDTGHEAPGCWTVLDAGYNCASEVVVEIYKCFDTCEDCLPLPADPLVPSPRMVDPGYDVGICSVEEVIKATCAFGRMQYEKMMSRRFKVQYCCPQDDIKVTVNYWNTMLQLARIANPTPDPCDPQCMRYEITIEIGDTAVITYTDCNDDAQTLEVNTAVVEQLIYFCAYNTLPVTAVVTHPDTTTDTYTLYPVSDECVPPAPELRECVGYEIVMTNGDTTSATFYYIDCNGEIKQNKANPFVKGTQTFTFCGLAGQTINPPSNLLPTDMFQVNITGDCTAGLPPCRTYQVIVQTDVDTTIRYVDCNGVDSSVVVFASPNDQVFTFCGIANQTLTTTGNVHNTFTATEVSDC